MPQVVLTAAEMARALGGLTMQDQILVEGACDELARSMPAKAQCGPIIAMEIMAAVGRRLYKAEIDD